MKLELPNGKSLQFMKGDITKVPVDAIANAANSALRGGGGVDGAIHRAGGPSIMRELDEIRAQMGACPTGSAVATKAGDLPAQYVFHAVGPVYHGGDAGEAGKLGSAYRACLDLGEKREVQALSLPAISTGIFGYPMDEAARIAVREVLEHLRSPAKWPVRIVFVLFDDAAFRAFASAAEKERRPEERVE